MALVMVAAPALAERAIPYSEMHTLYARVARLQGTKYFRAEARLASTDPEVPTERITLLVRSRGGDLPVPVDARGVARFPLRDDLLQEDPPVMTNVAKGKLSLKVSFGSEAPLAERFRYGLMVEMQDEAEALLAKESLVTRMFLPDFEGLAISFGKGVAATATVEAADGPVVFAADAEGVVHLPYKRAWKKEDPFVQLSRMPTAISLDAD
jgi:hypothetical protein